MKWFPSSPSGMKDEDGVALIPNRDSLRGFLMQKKVIALAVASLLSGGVFAQSVTDGTNPVQVSPDGGTTLLDAGPDLVVPGTVTTGTVTGIA